MRLMELSVCALIVVSALLSACSEEAKPPLVVTDIEITEPMPGSKMSAGYLSLTNNTDSAITLSRVVSPDFGSVEIHESLVDDGISKMRRIVELSIPANTTVTLKRGGKHLMLMRPSGTLRQARLSFHSGDALLLSVSAPITPRNN